MYSKRLAEWQSYFRTHGGQIKTAMIADINGISMGCRDAMLENGVEFLFTNIHCHHGMYPLYRNRTAFWWENAAGQRLLAWNGEHYNLGNVLGLKSNRSTNFMMQNHLGNATAPADRVEALHKNVEDYLNLCEENGYPMTLLSRPFPACSATMRRPLWKFLRIFRGTTAAMARNSRSRWFLSRSFTRPSGILCAMRRFTAAI